MKTPKQKSKELTEYFFNEIGINTTGYELLAKEFTIFLANEIINNKESISFWKEVIKETNEKIKNP